MQLWVNLPRDRSGCRRATRTSSRATSSLLSSDDGSSVVRVIAGELAGHKGPGVTYTPITYLHATVAPGAKLDTAVAA